jgi:hypothetical protein
VARFLRTNNYTETLGAFIREASLAPDVGQSSGDDTNNWTIQSLLEEKKTFDQSVNFERYGEASSEKGLWSVPGEIFLSIICLSTAAKLSQHPQNQTLCRHRHQRIYSLHRSNAGGSFARTKMSRSQNAATLCPLAQIEVFICSTLQSAMTPLSRSPGYLTHPCSHMYPSCKVDIF